MAPSRHPPHPPAAPPANPSDAALDKPLREAQDRFVSVWGQMSSAWGISRTMAEVHALLYITGEPLCTDDMMERLQISRGNASMSLRSLLDWGIVHRVTRRGDRKDYFRAEQDVWALFRAIVRERMNREVDPLLASLYEIRDLTGGADPSARRGAQSDAPQVRSHRERVDAMVEFFETLEKLGQRFVSPSGKGLQIAATLLNKLPDFSLGTAGRSRARSSRMPVTLHSVQADALDPQEPPAHSHAKPAPGKDQDQHDDTQEGQA